MWIRHTVTVFKTIDVTKILKYSKKNKLKFNMLMCYAIGSAASSMKEFYMLPVGGKLMKYDSIAVNTIVKNAVGEVSSCDIEFCDDIKNSAEIIFIIQKQCVKRAKIMTFRRAWLSARPH